MSSSTRKPGYYWLKNTPTSMWQIALWEADGWALHGIEAILQDEDFEDINEHPIRTIESLKNGGKQMDVEGPKIERRGRPRKHY